MSYDAFATTFSNSRKNLHWEELDAIIKDMSEHGYTRILDIGCGNGRFIANYEWRAIHDTLQYLWIDASKGMIEEAQKLYPKHEFRVWSMESIWSDGMISWPYDAILFLASFHHLATEEQRIDTLKQAKQLLTLGGRIYLTNWNLLDQAKYADAHTSDGNFAIKIWAHSRYYHGFTLDELAWVFRESWLQIVENRIFEWWRNLYSILTHA